MYISTPPSPEVENIQIKIYYLPGIEPAEPEADMLPSERGGELFKKINKPPETSLYGVT